MKDELVVDWVLSMVDEVWWEEIEGSLDVHEVDLAFHYSVHDAVICVSAFVVAF